MASILKDEEVLQEAAVLGLPQVAHAIANLPDENRAVALKAVEQGYCTTALALGYGEHQAWRAATVLVRLRTEVKQMTPPASPSVGRPIYLRQARKSDQTVVKRTVSTRSYSFQP